MADVESPPKGAKDILKGAFGSIFEKVQSRARARRMAAFEAAFDLNNDTRVLDLGGAAELWRDVVTPLNVTILNLPGWHIEGGEGSHHSFSFVDGDACDVHAYDDNTFDIVFSNSVIEHVGGPEKRQAFAREASRLAPQYWIQTPSVWFPLEPHSMMPYWFFYPESLRQRFIERWSRTRSALWADFVAGTDIVKRPELDRLFPDAACYTERSFGFPKSYSYFRSDKMGE